VALELWVSGCADIETIDKAAKDFGFPKGPFTTMDSVCRALPCPLLLHSLLFKSACTAHASWQRRQQFSSFNAKPLTLQQQARAFFAKTVVTFFVPSSFVQGGVISRFLRSSHVR
jgi:hypothetical protein